ncbi:MAG: 16S rRNA (guanine(527)-N(7))-methyltransferase RsmG [Thermotogota bacterium]
MPWRINDILIKNKYTKYLDLLEKENKKQNLISYQNRDELIQKHLEDSLIPFENDLIEPLKGKIVDIGSGGGFPAIPLVITFQNAFFTLIESEKRKCQFLVQVVESLDLTNAMVVNERVEDFSKETREEYDFCTMRAVAHTSVCLEYASAPLKVGGKVLLYKGPSFINELKESQNALKVLGMEFERTIKYEYSYKGESFTRFIAIFKKNIQTPLKYPRRPGMATKRPL